MKVTEMFIISEVTLRQKRAYCYVIQSVWSSIHVLNYQKRIKTICVLCDLTFYFIADAVSNLHVSDLSDSEGELTDLSQELDRELIAAAQRHMKTQSRPRGTGDDSFGDDIKGLDSDSSNGLCLSEAGGRDSPCLFPYRRSLRKRKISTSSSESDSDLSLKLNEI